MRKELLIGLIFLGIGIVLIMLGPIFLAPWVFLSYLSMFFGIDYFLLTLPPEGFFWGLVFGGFILLVLIGGFIGFLADKKIARKKKLIAISILLLIFIPLSGFSHYAKYQDNKIISENMVSGELRSMKIWDVSDQSICDKISDFNRNKKNDCYNAFFEKTGDKTVCSKLMYEYQRRDCLS